MDKDEDQAPVQAPEFGEAQEMDVDHYGGRENPYEAIKIIEALGWGRAFCLGNALKYIIRAGNKPGSPISEDLKKATWYINRAVYQVERGIK